MAVNPRAPARFPLCLLALDGPHQDAKVKVKQMIDDVELTRGILELRVRIIMKALCAAAGGLRVWCGMRMQGLSLGLFGVN